MTSIKTETKAHTPRWMALRWNEFPAPQANQINPVGCPLPSTQAVYHTIAFIDTPHRPIIGPVAVVGAENANRGHGEGSVHIDAPDVVRVGEPAPGVYLQSGGEQHVHVLVCDRQRHPGHGRGEVSSVVRLSVDEDGALVVAHGHLDNRGAVLGCCQAGGERGIGADERLKPRVHHSPRVFRVEQHEVAVPVAVVE